jgi:hypothetical protein
MHRSFKKGRSIFRFKEGIGSRCHPVTYRILTTNSCIPVNVENSTGTDQAPADIRRNARPPRNSAIPAVADPVTPGEPLDNAAVTNPAASRTVFFPAENNWHIKI